MPDQTVRFTIIAADEPAARDLARSAEESGASDVDVSGGGQGVITMAQAGFALVGTMTATAFTTWVVGRVKQMFSKSVLIRVPAKGEVQITELPISGNQVIAIGEGGQWIKHIDVDTDTKLGEMVTTLASGLIPSGGVPTSRTEVEEEAAAATKDVKS